MILDQINVEIITKMKSNSDKTDISVLKMLKSELLTNNKAASPRKEVDVIKSYLNKLKDAYKLSGDEKLKKEIEITQSFLPAGPSHETLVAAILSSLDALKAQGIEITSATGRIIGSVKKALPDADGETVKLLVEKTLRGE